MQAQYPLEEIDLGNGTTKRPTYISTKVGSDMKARIVEVLTEYKDCFAWDYDEMSCLESKHSRTSTAYPTWEEAGEAIPSTVCPECHFEDQARNRKIPKKLFHKDDKVRRMASQNSARRQEKQNS